MLGGFLLFCCPKVAYNTPNLRRRYICLLSLGVNRHHNDIIRGSQVVDDAIPAAFASGAILIRNTYFEKRIPYAWDLIAEYFSGLQRLDYGVYVITDMPIFLGKPA